MNNITLYNEYSEKEINEAIKMAGLNEYINSLEQGLNMKICESGITCQAAKSNA